MSILRKVVVHSISRKTIGNALNKAFRSRFSKMLIKPYIKVYKINRSEIRHPREYKSLTDFFTRDIAASLRPIDQGQETLVSPVDGKIVDLGWANQDKVILAKNNTYSIAELLADQDTEIFNGGYYLNIYLSPKNYHRIHMPFTATAVKHRYIPGKVFPVNNLGISTIKDLFAKNRRTCTLFKTPEDQSFALIKVGALGVGKIISNFQEGDRLTKGSEIGRFEFGSTVILIFQRGIFVPDEKLAAGDIMMGQIIGKIQKEA